MTTPGAADLYLDLAGLLTRVARLVRTDGTPADFSDLLAAALAAAAANVGGPDQLLAGRPGSWESAVLRDLLQGTMGDDERIWTGYRTEPVTVTLNVAEIIEGLGVHPGLLGLSDALYRLETEHPHRTDADDARFDRLCEQVEDRYRRSYQQYAEHFTDVVRILGAALIPGLTVIVDTDVNPFSAWWETTTVTNPEPYEDPVVDELWLRARDIVALPNVDVDLRHDHGGRP